MNGGVRVEDMTLDDMKETVLRIAVTREFGPMTDSEWERVRKGPTTDIERMIVDGMADWYRKQYGLDEFRL